MIGVQGTAVNTVSTEGLLNTLNFVKQSKVTLDDTTVSYRVIPTSGSDEPTSEEQSKIFDFLSGRLIMGYSLLYMPNTYVDLLDVASESGVASNIILDIIYLKGYDTSIIEGHVKQVIQDVTNPLIKATYGSGFDLTDVDVLIRGSVQGVQSVSFKATVNSQETPMRSITIAKTSIFKQVDAGDIICRFDAI